MINVAREIRNVPTTAEHPAVNRRVVGSNPTGGANGIAATFVTAILILGPLAQLVRATGS